MTITICQVSTVFHKTKHEFKAEQRGKKGFNVNVYNSVISLINNPCTDYVVINTTSDYKKKLKIKNSCQIKKTHTKTLYFNHHDAVVFPWYHRQAYQHHVKKHVLFIYESAKSFVCTLYSICITYTR